MAANISSKNFANVLANNRQAEQEEIKTEQPKEEPVKIEEPIKEQAKKIAEDDIKKINTPKEQPKTAKEARVRDASTILSLLLDPEMKAFIRFEADRKKMNMNQYIWSLVEPDYKKDGELFRQYQEFMEKMGQ